MTFDEVKAQYNDQAILQTVEVALNRDSLLKEYSDKAWEAVKNAKIQEELSKTMNKEDLEEFNAAFDVSIPVKAIRGFFPPLDAIILHGCQKHNCGHMDGTLIYLPTEPGNTNPPRVFAATSHLNSSGDDFEVTIYNNPPEDIKQVLLYAVINGTGNFPE